MDKSFEQRLVHGGLTTGRGTINAVIVNEETASVLLGPKLSVTIMVQLGYVPTGSGSKVIVLSPTIALAVTEPHEPP